MEPHDYLATYNKFVLDDESRKAIAGMKHPADLEEICADLKVCGRREMSELLKIRYKYSVSKIPKEEEPAERPKELTAEQLEAAVDKELEESIKRLEREKKKAAKKTAEAEKKADTRKKMSVIAGAAVENDEDLVLDEKTWERVRELGIDELHKHIDKEEDSEGEMSDLERRYKFHTDGGTRLADEGGEDGGEEDDKARTVNRMAEELEE